jgi:hypothetical protein
MTLSFPNPNRSFDPDSKRILFWGYDNIMEISFYLETEALDRFNSEKTKTESGFLQIFDEIRNQIYEVANNVYTRVGKGNRAYVLSPKDF